MNIAKHMEVIFVAAAVIGAATSYASAANDRAEALAPAAITTVIAKADSSMPSVTVSAKRLTAAEKAAL
ncbi:hypothetical protein [Duganella callida]|uniref:TonB-dependent receptor n=1 Tax=Duganella callida TaxID=2561932 RepID=A0A4Y9S2I0_9BURK|nr:hypothetical protein [Duganella callida]TFW15512.1 hypothetical protein E4L98_26370 [Duganella callida]